MRKAAVLIVLALLAIPAKAQESFRDDLWTEYCGRQDTATAQSGNAKAANSAIHTANPWPPYAWDRSFPASGERMSGAIRRYHDVTKLHEAASTPSPDQSSSGSSGALSSAGGK